MTTDARTLAASERAVLVAPAGCGKTDLICQAVKATDGRSILLTHTHAGVHAMRLRLEKHGARPASAWVDTIAGFSLRLSLAFPAHSGFSLAIPETKEHWGAVYSGALRVLESPHVRNVMRISFPGGVYVDEYQDCERVQHLIVLQLAKVLRVRVVGDPLQGIFDFKGQDPVSWDNDVLPNFFRLEDLSEPWRWNSTNPSLGKWLLSIRDTFIKGGTIDFSDAPVTINQPTEPARIAASRRAGRNASESVVLIGRWAEDCHRFASKLSGQYGSMEEMYCGRLMEWAKDIESCPSQRRPCKVIDLASECFTKVGTRLAPLRAKYQNDETPSPSAYPSLSGIVAALNSLIRGELHSELLAAMKACESIPGSVQFRRELWSEAKLSVRKFHGAEQTTLFETAWHVRDRVRRGGRRSERLVVSRTLLIKGLEFDHSLLLDVDALAKEPKHLYVALTRGSRSVTIFANSPRVTIAAARNQLSE